MLPQIFLELRHLGHGDTRGFPTAGDPRGYEDMLPELRRETALRCGECGGQRRIRVVNVCAHFCPTENKPTGYRERLSYP
jgi:hypothetical protein